MSSIIGTRGEVRADIERILNATNELLRTGGLSMTMRVPGELLIVSVGMQSMYMAPSLLALSVHLKHLSTPIQVWEHAIGMKIEARSALHRQTGTIIERSGVLGFTLDDFTPSELRGLEFQLMSRA